MSCFQYTLTNTTIVGAAADRYFTECPADPRSVRGKSRRISNASRPCGTLSRQRRGTSRPAQDEHSRLGSVHVVLADNNICARHGPLTKQLLRARAPGADFEGNNNLSVGLTAAVVLP